MGAASWTDRGEGQSGLDIEIAPRKDYWYALGLHSTPDGKISEKTTVSQTIPGTTTTTNEVKYNQTFTVSAQFAKRLGDHVVASAGIVESKGGAGLEYRTFEDRFRIGALAYDFDERDDKPNPRVRLTTSYEFWKGLYGQAGVQDVANPDLRTFFVGGGVRWKDEDLKRMLGLLGNAVK
jgi:phospholipid/cholesterol/gamma-HCH transport system substrate-binding protein